MRAGRWAEGFWGVAGAASIRVKVMGIVIGLILMLGVPVTLVVRQGLSAALERELEERGVAIALSLASRSQELVLTDRLLALYTLAVVVNLARGRREIDCGCFGPAARQPLSAALVSLPAARACSITAGSCGSRKMSSCAS